MKPIISLRHALEDPTLLAPVMGGASRAPMRALLLASQGEALTESELAHYRELTGREQPPAERVAELDVIAGRRAGKSSGTAALATYLAALCDYSDCLQPGERGVVLIVAENQRQARVLLQYIAGAFDASSALAGMISHRTQTSLALNNGIDIEVRAADFRALRGLTLVAALCDEIAFWRSDYSANPDVEIVNAIRPGLVTTRGQLVTIGSPYARSGFQYQTFCKHFGDKGDARIIVAKGATAAFNPTIDKAEIERAFAADPIAAASEWGGEFRSDLEQFVSQEALDAVTEPGRPELPRVSGVSYVGFCDPSGGSSDSMCLAIAHEEEGVAVLDLIREARAPFSPDDVTKEFAGHLRAYGVSKVVGDRYAGQWPVERFRQHGIAYEPSAQPKSALYGALLPLIMSRRCELLDNVRLANQLLGLERRVGRSGKDSIDHGPGAHDDVANAAAGALVLASQGSGALAGLADYGTGVDIPCPVRAIYAVCYVEAIGANVGRAAIAIFADQRFISLGVTLCDFRTGMLSDAWLRDAIVRLAELADATRAPRFAFLADRSTLRRFEPIAHAFGDTRAAWDACAEVDQQLPAAAAAHVASGRVKITNEALLKAQTTPLADALSFEFGRRTELSVALMLGVCAAFEEA